MPTSIGFFYGKIWGIGGLFVSLWFGWADFCKALLTTLIYKQSDNGYESEFIRVGGQKVACAAADGCNHNGSRRGFVLQGAESFGCFSLGCRPCRDR